jgi:RimJ/RimL family protein N-acetyltransferase
MVPPFPVIETALRPGIHRSGRVFRRDDRSECDLASDRVPPGEACIRVACHPAHRGRGYEQRAAGLVTRFLRDHTGARLLPVVCSGVDG